MKSIPVLLILCLSLSLISCSREDPARGDVLAMINDYALTVDEFERQLFAETEMFSNYKLTREAKSAFLEDLIRKELLIQEAKRLELDRKQKFMKAIERYWEATLIRDLMEVKGEEISGRVLVSQDEIMSEYTRLKTLSTNVLPLSELQEEVQKKLKDKKMTRMMEKWAQDFRSTAHIDINRKLLYGEQ
jgi:hypothetical protein